MPDDHDDWWAPLAFSRPNAGVPLPPAGAPLRVAFVGQRTYFEVCAQQDPTRAIEPYFIDFRDGVDESIVLRRLEDIAPHVIVVFRPELLAPGTLARYPALVVGVLTEPLPRTADGEIHPDLQRRRAFLQRFDVENVDRLIAFDPHIIPTVETLVPVWRAAPLPVSDRVYRWTDDVPSPPRVGFIGRSTPHRERFLQPAKHHYDLFHVDHGLHGEYLLDTMATLHVAVNLHNEPYPTFENRVALHLAAGHLVVSEPLSPQWGLDPGLDFVEMTEPTQLLAVLDEVAVDPAAFDWIRRRGHHKAELFRASRCWARIVHDLIYDVAAFGRGAGSPQPEEGGGSEVASSRVSSAFATRVRTLPRPGRK